MATFSLWIFLIGNVLGASLDIDKECSINLSEIPTQANFDIKKFMGVWYTHFTTTYMFDENTWDSMSNVIYPHADESITTVTTGHEKRTDKCRIAIVYSSHGSQEDTGYAGMFFKSTTYFKVVHSDYNNAAIFYCFDVDDDGTCHKDKAQIALWSRKVDDMTPDLIHAFKSYLAGVECVDVKDLIAIDQGFCEPSSTFEPLELGESGFQHAPHDLIGDLDADNPFGEWCSCIVAVEDGQQPISAGLRLIKGSSERTVYLVYSHQSGDTCTPTKTEEYKQLSQRHFLEIGAKNPKEFWTRALPNGNLIMFWCLQRHDGLCTQSKIHVLSHEIKPTSLAMIKTFENHTTSIFGNKYEYFITQRYGQCMVPELIENIILGNDIMQYSHKKFPKQRKSGQKMCKVSDIHAEKHFNEKQLVGLWYEIARTRSIYNSFESPVVYFQHNNDNTLHSWYSGAINSKCSPAIPSHTKSLQDDAHIGEMEVKLNGPPGLFNYMDFRVVYNDGMYSVHYGCFRKNAKGKCLYPKASIYGRQPHIDNNMKQKLFAMLPMLCVSLDDMQETFHNVDCSKYVIPHTETPKHQCHVDDIPAQKSVSLERMAGTWYIVASSDQAARRLDIRRKGEVFEGHFTVKKNGKCITLPPRIASQSKHNDGNLLLGIDDGAIRPLNPSKVVFTNYNLNVHYSCLDEGPHGECSPESTVISILSRSKEINSVQMSLLKSQLKLPCGDLSNLTTITDTCEKGLSCRVDDVPSMKDLDTTKISGIWYALFGKQPGSAKAVKQLQSRSAVVFKFTPEAKGRISVSMTSLSSNGTCNEPLTTFMKPKETGVVGEYLLRPVRKKPVSGFLHLKTVYTDYVNVLIQYICAKTMSDGTCGMIRMMLLSRTRTIDPEVKASVMHYFEDACVDLRTVKEINQEGVDCAASME